MPALSKAKEIAKGGVCQSNLRNMFPALLMYMNEHDGTITGWNTMPHVPGDFDKVIPGQTGWFLELYRSMGGDSSRWPDTRAIFDARHSRDWINAMPILQCPNGLNKEFDGSPAWLESGKRISSYMPNNATWCHTNTVTKKSFMLASGDTSWDRPYKTMYFNFNTMSRPADSIMLSEGRYNNMFQSISNTNQTANSVMLQVPHTIQGRWLHPGAGKLRDLNNNEWEGKGSYLHFDGHVSQLQIPTYAFNTVNFAHRPPLPTYAAYTGQ
jgi:hypothetical protein